MTQRFFVDQDGNYLGSYDGPDETLPDIFKIALEVSQIPEDLLTVKATLKTDIDRAAEVERRKYITSGSGQAMTYMQKADEAAKYLKAQEPQAVDYPLLSAEVGITADTLGEVAQIVHAAFSQWQVIGAAIESARLSTKAAIDSATSAADAQAAAAGVQWP